MDENKRFSDDHWKDYMAKGLAAFFVIGISILFFFALFKINAIKATIAMIIKILQPILIGLAIAYILDPVVCTLEKYIIKLFKNAKKREKAESASRLISAFIAILAGVAVIYILGSLVIPELILSIMRIIREFPGYADSFLLFIQDLSEQESWFSPVLEEMISSITEYFENWLRTDLLKQIEYYIGYFTSSVLGIVSLFLNFIIGLIISTYVLCSKKKFMGQGKKLIYGIFKPRYANAIMDVVRKSHMIFGGFITGKLLDSLIIGIICFIVLSLLNMPYFVLVSVIIGVTNIIPFFGPYIGAIPSAFLILLVDPKQGIIFIIFIIILQQVDGNIIGPKILGSSTGLSAFWVVFSILLGGGLFGLAGMILGVPTFGVIYFIVKTLIEYRLKKRNLPVESDLYCDVERIDAGGEKFTYNVKMEKVRKARVLKVKNKNIKK